MKTKNETFNPYAEENEFAVRPEWGYWFFYRKPNRKEEIRFRRAKAAYDLAALVAKNSFDGKPTPTKAEVEEAYTLLNSIIRYALADVQHWEHENSSERYCNSKQCEEDEKRLDERRKRLNARLKEYGCKLVNYGLYPTIKSIESGEDYSFLHFFDD